MCCVQEDKYLEIYHEKLALEEKNMDQVRTIKDLNSQISTLNDKIARGVSVPSFGMSFSSYSDVETNKKNLELDAEEAAKKK